MAQLINGLGGAAGFGENLLARNDDDSTGLVSLAEAFPAGLDFFGVSYTGLYVNNNGSVTFAAPTDDYTPTAITGTTNNPIIAPFWADVDTRLIEGGIAGGTTPGGTSLGTDLMYYDQDAATGTFTVTWDDVGYFDGNTDKLNAFQLRLTRFGSTDFSIEFRYEDINWVTGDASGGTGGLGGRVARAGYSSGNGVNFLELSQSGNQAALLNLASASNVGEPGVYRFDVHGVTTAPVASTPSDEVFSGQVGALNTVSFASGLRSASIATGTNGPRQVSSPGSGSDTLFSIEVLSFVDGRMVYDPGDIAAQVARLYQAALGRGADQAGLNGWIDALRHGASLDQISEGFLASDEFLLRYPGAGDVTVYVTQLYANVLGRGPDPSGQSFWLGQLGTGAMNRAQVLTSFSESNENLLNTAPLVAAGIWDRDENAIVVARLYDAVLGRAPDVQGLAWHAGRLAGGTALSTVADDFVGSNEFQSVYGALANPEFVERLYLNTLHRLPDPDGLNGWVGFLAQGGSRTDVAIGFSESLEHALNTEAAIQPGSGSFGILFI